MYIFNVVDNLNSKRWFFKKKRCILIIWSEISKSYIDNFLKKSGDRNGI
jgi:hypothetical protein